MAVASGANGRQQGEGEHLGTVVGGSNQTLFQKSCPVRMDTRPVPRSPRSGSSRAPPPQPCRRTSLALAWVL